MSLFTLESGSWYACELIGDEFDWGEDPHSFSPIRVERVTPRRKGNRTFELSFFHQNYPEGVQDKVYRLKTLERGERYILAHSLDHNPSRLLLIYKLQPEWIRQHFPGYRPTEWDLKQWFGQEPKRSSLSSGSGTRIYGLDFTSAPSDKKPLTCAVCTLNEGVLLLEELKPLDSFPGFESLLASEGPWVMGLDFPFGQPRKLIENLDWPQTWEGYVRHVEVMGKQVFEETLRRYVKGREPGDKHHLRAVDGLATAQSPMKLDYTPVAKMFFQGAPRLAKAAVSVLPCRPTGDDRVVVEAYPALVARKAVGKRGYKEDKKGAQAEEKRSARADIITWLAGDMPRQHYGFDVSIDDSFLSDLTEDAGGDLLDSVLCAIQAAWAYTHRDYGYGIPDVCDPLEGCIADPLLWDHACSGGSPKG